MTDKKTKKGLIVLSVISVLALILFGLSFRKNTGNKPSFSFNFKNSSKEYIAVVHITGVIQEKGLEYNQSWLLRTIKELKTDEHNAGIMLFIDSPGGTVYHSDEAYLSLLDYKKTGKKVYAYFGTMAASGGYYIGCAADKIFANRNTITGSIGVISASTIDATELMKKIGIKSTTIHAGKNKNMLNWNEPATAEQVKIMQDIADEAYEQFTSIVSLSRHMDLKEVKKLADGRIYTAKQAQTNGLVDEVVTLETAEALIKNELNNSELVFKGFRYKKPDNLRSLLTEGISIIKNPQAAINPGNKLNYLYSD